MKKYKVIIDTDPGVDDTTALILALFDKSLDIKLITSVVGNISAEIGARNACHLMDLLNKNIPVAVGAHKAMVRTSEDAAWLHGKEGMGAYIPPKETKHQPLNADAIDEMYRVITENPFEVIIFVWGPHTNVGHLLSRYPDSARLIKQIIFMGASPYGVPNIPLHISFNIKCDPEAFKIVLDSGVPLVMAPSNIGRLITHLTEKQVEQLKNLNEVGKLLAKMYEIYWEPKAKDKRIATNDTVALFYLKHPKMFKTINADIFVDLQKDLGKTYARFHKEGKVKIIMDANRSKFMSKFFRGFKKLNNVKLDKNICSI